MLRIITCNVLKDYNLGGPSIIYGIDALMKELYGQDYEITNFEKLYIEGPYNNNIPMKTVYHKCIQKRDLFSWMVGNSKSLGLPQMIREISKADVVIDLYGICYCDNLLQADYAHWKYPIINFKSSIIAWLAKKILHKKVIKNAASYGPITKGYNKYAATYFANNIYDVMVAREQESRRVMQSLGTIKKEILYAPDIANIMPYDTSIIPDKNKVCVSISHQIKRQWATTEDYVTCLIKLCQHMADEGKEIVLVPNECVPGVYNDTSVAREIISELRNQSINISILPVEQMTAVEIKNEIASSGALIASRYHSCVAGLSAGVPTLVIGWHYKYDELLTSYGQGEWILSNHNCDSQKLIAMYDKFMAAREDNLVIIAKQKDVVRAKVLEVGREMMERAGVL